MILFKVAKDVCQEIQSDQKDLSSSMAQQVKNLPAMQETQEPWFQSLGWEDPLEKEMTTPSNILAWKNPMDKGAWQATVHGLARGWR